MDNTRILTHLIKRDHHKTYRQRRCSRTSRAAKCRCSPALRRPPSRPPPPTTPPPPDRRRRRARPRTELDRRSRRSGQYPPSRTGRGHPDPPQGVTCGSCQIRRAPQSSTSPGEIISSRRRPGDDGGPATGHKKQTVPGPRTTITLRWIARNHISLHLAMSEPIKSAAEECKCSR